MVLELNDEAAEQTVEAKVVDLLQGQEGFRWKVRRTGLVCADTTHSSSLLYLLGAHCSLEAVISHCTVTFPSFN